MVASIESAGTNWRKSVGCEHCFGHGYTGRTGIHEVVQVTPELQHMILSGESERAMFKLAQSQGSRSLRADGLLKASQGITSVDEVLRVTASDS